MIILISLAIVLSIGLIFMRYAVFELLALILIVLSGFGLILTAIILPVNIMEINSAIKQFQAVEITVNTARMNGEKIENAAMQLEIIKANQWLAAMKYYNHTVFDIWIPDSVESLQQIK